MNSFSIYDGYEAPATFLHHRLCPFRVRIVAIVVRGDRGLGVPKVDGDIVMEGRYFEEMSGTRQEE